MGVKDVLQELGGYSALLEMSSNPGLQMLGKRLGELADQIAKEQQAPRCWCLGPDGKSLCVRGEPPNAVWRPLKNAWPPSYGIMVKHCTANMDGTVSPAPTPEAVLLKEMADWWEHSLKTAHVATQSIYDELRDSTRRAFNIVNS